MAEQLALPLTESPLTAAEQRVFDYVQGVIGRRTPTYLRRVTRVTEILGGVIADVVMFDGRPACVEFRGSRWNGIHQTWHSGLSKKHGGSFGFDEKLKRWRRYPEHAQRETSP